MCRGESIGVVQDRSVHSPSFISRANLPWKALRYLRYWFSQYSYPILCFAAFTLAVNTSQVQMPLLLTQFLLYSQQALPFASSYVSGFHVYTINRTRRIKKKKKSRSTKYPMHQTARSRQIAADQHRVGDVICNALLVKQWIFPMENQKQTISYLGANWRVVNANREPDLPAVQQIWIWGYSALTLFAVHTYGPRTTRSVCWT